MYRSSKPLDGSNSDKTRSSSSASVAAENSLEISSFNHAFGQLSETHHKLNWLSLNAGCEFPRLRREIDLSQCKSDPNRIHSQSCATLSF